MAGSFAAVAVRSKEWTAKAEVEVIRATSTQGPVAAVRYCTAWYAEPVEADTREANEKPMGVKAAVLAQKVKPNVPLPTPCAGEVVMDTAYVDAYPATPAPVVANK